MILGAKLDDKKGARSDGEWVRRELHYTSGFSESYFKLWRSRDSFYRSPWLVVFLFCKTSKITLSFWVWNVQIGNILRDALTYLIDPTRITCFVNSDVVAIRFARVIKKQVRHFGNCVHEFRFTGADVLKKSARLLQVDIKWIIQPTSPTPPLRYSAGKSNRGCTSEFQLNSLAQRHHNDHAAASHWNNC